MQCENISRSKFSEYVEVKHIVVWIVSMHKILTE